MNADPENFDALRRLLRLKRYEQPPPGYFHNFSGHVLARISAGERAEPASVLAQLFGESSWWRRVSAALESRPGFAGAFGAAVCALLISGIVYSENAPAPAFQALIPADSATTLAAATTTESDSWDQTQFATGSTNPVAPVIGSLFDQFSPVKAQPVNLEFPGVN